MLRMYLSLIQFKHKINESNQNNRKTLLFDIHTKRIQKIIMEYLTIELEFRYQAATKQVSF